MRIAIDGMGGDHAPDEIVSGVIEAAALYPDARLLLVGQKDRVGRPNLPRNVEVIHASDRNRYPINVPAPGVPPNITRCLICGA